jgi:amidase
VKVSEYADLDAVALAALVRQGEVTPAELAATAREAVESVNGQLNALAFPLYGEPLACAPDGPFAGVPFLIDDESHTMESWLASIFAVGPFTAAFNISGHPAISLPLARTAAQVPVGVQVVARYGREDVLFRVASQLEQALPGADRRPPVCAG